MGKVNTDLKGLATLQKNYLDSLSDKTNDPDLSTKVATLQGQLSSAHQDFEDANISSSNVLTHQDKVKDIVDTEKARLLEKKQTIDNALVGKKRAIALNDSYQKKQAEYNKIKYAWVMALAISVILVISKKNFQFLPSFVFDLFTILVLFGASIYTIRILVEVSRREKTNFNKLDLPDPAARTAAELQAAAKAASFSVSTPKSPVSTASAAASTAAFSAIFCFCLLVINIASCIACSSINLNLLIILYKSSILLER